METAPAETAATPERFGWGAHHQQRRAKNGRG